MAGGTSQPGGTWWRVGAPIGVNEGEIGLTGCRHTHPEVPDLLERRPVDFREEMNSAPYRRMEHSGISEQFASQWTDLTRPDGRRRKEQI